MKLTDWHARQLVRDPAYAQAIAEEEHMKIITLKSSVWGHFDMTALAKAIHDHGPFEPETEYSFHLDVTRPTSVVVEAPPEPPAPKARRASQA
jgi:hypothetical protein